MGEQIKFRTFWKTLNLTCYGRAEVKLPVDLSRILRGVGAGAADVGPEADSHDDVRAPGGREGDQGDRHVPGEGAGGRTDHQEPNNKRLRLISI